MCVCHHAPRNFSFQFENATRYSILPIILYIDSQIPAIAEGVSPPNNPNNSKPNATKPVSKAPPPPRPALPTRLMKPKGPPPRPVHKTTSVPIQTSYSPPPFSSSLRASTLSRSPEYAELVSLAQGIIIQLGKGSVREKTHYRHTKRYSLLLFIIWFWFVCCLFVCLFVLIYNNYSSEIVLGYMCIDIFPI